jgi:hypothetical protein
MKLHGERATIIGLRVSEVELPDLVRSFHRLAAALICLLEKTFETDCPCQAEMV